MTYEPIPLEQKRQLATLCMELWSSVLVGNPAPRVAERLKRMENPRPGDFVIECSTIYALLNGRYDQETAESLWDSQLVKFVREDTIVHRYEGDPGSYPEKAFVCEKPDGAEFNWTNAQLIAVPMTKDAITR